MTTKTNCNDYIADLIIKGGKDSSEMITLVAKEFGVTRNAAQKRIAKVREKMKLAHSENSSNNTPVADEIGKIIPGKETHDFDKGEHTYEGKIALHGKFPINEDGSPIDDQYVLEQYHLDKSKWRVVSFTINYWESQTKNGTALDLHQYKLTVAPMRDIDYTPEDVANILAKKIAETVKTDNSKRLNDILKSSTKVKGNNKGYVVTIELADVHIGLLSWWRETGEDFDINIMRKQVMHAVYEIVNKITTFNIPVAKFILVTLGDLLHVDNDMQTTTRGTHQQVEGRLPKMTDAAFDLLYDIILELRTIAPVEYVYIQGNHDKDLGRMVAFSVMQAFRNIEGVSFDVEPNPHKYRIIGNVALGWTHGDMNKKNLDGLMNNMVRNQTNVDLMYLHVGHLHSSSSYQTTDGRCTVEHVDALCPASLWEHQQGYGKTPKRYVKAFLFSGDAVPPETFVGAVE